MLPSDAVLLGSNTPTTSAARDDGGSHETCVLFSLFLVSAFLFFVAFELFGVRAAAGVMSLFLVVAIAFFHCVRRVSRDFPFLHISPRRPADDANGGGFVGTSGMRAAAIASLPVAFVYERDHAAATGWAQCTICLGLVQVGEAVRRLPACGHLFHAGCIDKWLRAHATCPLCRAAVVPAAVPELLPV
jgi:hypothetical protein